MKKCPYCAEEIQDEAVFCRYCHHDLVPTDKLVSIIPDGLPKKEAPSGPTLKLKSVFWPSLGFGLMIGGLLFSYNMSQPTLPQFGFSGHFDNAVTHGITSIFIYGFLFSLVIFVWRVVIKRIPGVKVFSTASGCASMTIFASMWILIFIGFPLLKASDPNTTTPPENVQAVPTRMITRTPTKPLPTSQPYNPYSDLYDQKKENDLKRLNMRERVNTLYKAGYLTTMLGEYQNLPDFSESFSQIDWFQKYLMMERTRSFVIRADVTWESASTTPNSSSTGCGFMFHSVDQDNFYIAFLSLDGQANIIRFQNKTSDADWHKMYGKVTSPTGNAELMLAVEDNQFTFLVNNQVMLSISDDKIRGDQIGLSIHSGTNKDFGTRCTMTGIDFWELEQPK